MNAHTEVRVKVVAIETFLQLKNIFLSVFCEEIDLRFDPLMFNTITLNIIDQEVRFYRKKRKTKEYKLLRVQYHV